jgi:hypothetical protein
MALFLGLFSDASFGSEALDGTGSGSSFRKQAAVRRYAHSDIHSSLQYLHEWAAG